MTKRIVVSGGTVWLGLTLLVLSAATDAAGPVVQRGQSGQAMPMAQGASAPTIELTVGAQRTLASGHTLQRVAIGDPAVADVLIIKGDRRGGVLLVGKSAGTTSLMVWERERDAPQTYTVNVMTPAAASLLGPDTPGLKVLGQTAVVSGSAATMEAHQRAVVAAEGSLGKDGAVFDTSTVASRAVVQVDVRVVEFSRSVLKEVGFNFFSQRNGFCVRLVRAELGEPRHRAAEGFYPDPRRRPWGRRWLRRWRRPSTWCWARRPKACSPT